MLWILAALIGCYAVFVFAPAVVAVCTIFRAKPGDSFDALLAPGAQFAPYAERMRAAKARFDAFPKQRISIAACDGVVLSADYCDRKSAKTAILMHGYRTDPMVNFAMQADMFLRHGYNVLLIRQRGHEAGGKARCGLGLLERYDAIAWNEHALSTEGVEETVLYGVSMGAAAVGFAACDLDPKKTRALILDCGFRSPYEQIRLDCRRRNVPGFLLMPPIRLLAKLFLKFDIRDRTDDVLKNTAIPCFFLHGTKDLTVPYETAREVFDACGAKKAFFTAEGAGHTEAFIVEPERAEQELFAFLGEEQTIENHQQEEE